MIEHGHTKNFTVTLLTDLPSAAANTATNFSPGKGVGRIDGITENGGNRRLEVYNYTVISFRKNDHVVVCVDNFGRARVVGSTYDYPLICADGGYGAASPTMTKVVYSQNDYTDKKLGADTPANVGLLNLDSGQPGGMQAGSFNPLHFRPGQPCIYANVAGFSRHVLEADAVSHSTQPPELANNIPCGMIPISQDCRSHFRIPANDSRTFAQGDIVFLHNAGAHWELATTQIGSIVGICDWDKTQTQNFDFWMPFYPLGFMDSLVDSWTSAQQYSTRFGYAIGNDNTKCVGDAGRGDFVRMKNGQQWYNPIFVERFRVTAGTSYPVAVEWLGDWTITYDIELTEAQWLEYYAHNNTHYGTHNGLMPNIYSGDYITCIVDGSGQTPSFTPINFPLDYGAGMRLYCDGSHSPGRDWIIDQDFLNDVVGGVTSTTIVTMRGSFAGGKFQTDQNGTEIPAMTTVGAWYKKQRGSALVCGNA